MSLSGPVACPETFNTESEELGTLRQNESSWVWANFCDPEKSENIKESTKSILLALVVLGDGKLFSAKELLFVVQIINGFCCLFFLQEKQEWWWIYVTDRRKTELITPPQQIFNLKDEEKVKFLFDILFRSKPWLA